MLEASKNGFDVRIHAIGDASATMIIDAVERAEEVCGNKGGVLLSSTDNLKLEDIARMKRLALMLWSSRSIPSEALGRACTRSLLAKSA